MMVRRITIDEAVLLLESLPTLVSNRYYCDAEDNSGPVVELEGIVEDLYIEFNNRFSKKTDHAENVIRGKFVLAPPHILTL